MWYIFNGTNRCIAICSHRPDPDDLDRRNEYALESNLNIPLSEATVEEGIIVKKEVIVTLDEYKAIQWKAIKSIRDTKEKSGFIYMDKQVDSDDIAVQRMSIAAIQAQSALVANLPFVITWTCADNTVLTISTPQEMLGMAQALAQFSNVLHVKARGYRQQIEEATTTDDVASIIWED